MELSTAQINDILAILNETEGFDDLHAERPYDLEQWLGNENDRFDTVGAGLRIGYVRWLQEQISQAWKAGGEARASLKGAGERLITVDDYFYFSGQKAKGSKGVQAYRVWQTVFERPAQGGKRSRVWRARPWLDRGDPLMRLPYSRKYDHERADYATAAQTRLWEELSYAYDLLMLARQQIAEREIRVYDVELQHLTEREFKLPNLKDIQDELATIDLGIGIDDLGGLIGSVGFELVRLRPKHERDGLDSEGNRRRDYSVVEGRYRGPLSLYRRHVRGATSKRMVVSAFDECIENLGRLLNPLRDEDLPGFEQIDYGKWASFRVCEG